MAEIEIIDGVRRAKAAQMAGYETIHAIILDVDGNTVGEREVPIDSLHSPKAEIRRRTAADRRRWSRVVQGAAETMLPFPPILVQAGARGTAIHDVGFDIGT